jgi:hypothetical protein
LQNFFHWYILQSWKLKRRWLPYLYTFSLYENASFIIVSAETEYISTRSWYRNINFLRDRIRRIFLFFQICAAIYQLLLHMVFTSRNWFVMQGLVAIILISWNVIFIWETGYWTRAIKRLDVNTICRRSWYIDAHIWKIYDFKIEVVPFIINFSTELTAVVKFEVYVQKWCLIVLSDWFVKGTCRLS